MNEKLSNFLVAIVTFFVVAFVTYIVYNHCVVPAIPLILNKLNYLQVVGIVAAFNMLKHKSPYTE